MKHPLTAASSDRSSACSRARRRPVPRYPAVDVADATPPHIRPSSLRRCSAWPLRARPRADRAPLQSSHALWTPRAPCALSARAPPLVLAVLRARWLCRPRDT
eukprot:1527876-Prymnesium_polylepis.2